MLIKLFLQFIQVRFMVGNICSIVFIESENIPEFLIRCEFFDIIKVIFEYYRIKFYFLFI